MTGGSFVLIEIGSCSLVCLFGFECWPNVGAAVRSSAGVLFRFEFARKRAARPCALAAWSWQLASSPESTLNTYNYW
jgi:hypothetical protein